MCSVGSQLDRLMAKPSKTRVRNSGLVPDCVFCCRRLQPWRRQSQTSQMLVIMLRKTGPASLSRAMHIQACRSTIQTPPCQTGQSCVPRTRGKPCRYPFARILIQHCWSCVNTAYDAKPPPEQLNVLASLTLKTHNSPRCALLQLLRQRHFAV